MKQPRQPGRSAWWRRQVWLWALLAFSWPLTNGLHIKSKRRRQCPRSHHRARIRASPGGGSRPADRFTAYVASIKLQLHEIGRCDRKMRRIFEIIETGPTRAARGLCIGSDDGELRCLRKRTRRQAPATTSTPKRPIITGPNGGTKLAATRPAYGRCRSKNSPSVTNRKVKHRKHAAASASEAAKRARHLLAAPSPEEARISCLRGRLACGGNYNSEKGSRGGSNGGQLIIEKPGLGRLNQPCNCWLAVLLVLVLLLQAGFKLHWREEGAAKRAGAASASTLADFDGATFYKAPVGSRVRIACNASDWRDDSVQLILWFKGSSLAPASQPIYTVDARQRSLGSGQARHLVADGLRGRAKFVVPSSNQTLAGGAPISGPGQQQVPYLDLAPLEAQDQGEYRCRVDYRSRPRENFLMILFVLVPPTAVEIVEPNGRQLEQIYGPLSEGSDLTLLCLARGGRPPPAVSWRREGRVIDETYLTLNDFVALELAGELLGEPHPGQPDKDLGQAPGEHSINADQPANSSQAGRAQWRDWAGWPEFEYFRDSAAAGAADWPPGQSQRPAAQSKPAPAGLSLLEWPVDERLVSAANVLRAPGLGRDALLAPAEAGPNEGGVPPLARLECQASNLHYDLRALIRMFAPPSLAPARPQQPEPTGALEGVAPRRRQLAAAMRRALELSLSAPATGAGSAAAQPASLLQAERQVVADEQRAPSSAQPAHQQLQSRPPGELILGQLARAHQLSSQQLQQPADQSPASAHQQLVRSKLIALDAILRPTEVRVAAPGRPLAAGQLAEFECSAAGSRPAARLSWLLDGRPLEPRPGPQGQVTISELADNATLASTSRLVVRLEHEHHGSRLTCRAENGRLRQSHPDWTIEDSLSLQVQYAPRLRLELGNRMLSESAREGSDIYFVCQVDAQPPVRELTWLHNERPINDSSPRDGPSKAGGPLAPEAGGQLIISNNSLVLQRVRLDQRGQYACMASNSEGMAASNRIELRVLHAPICIGGHVGSGPTEDAPSGAGPAGRTKTTTSTGPEQSEHQAGPDNNALELEAEPLALGAHRRFRCQWLVEASDGDQVRFGWYHLGATGGGGGGQDRRPLAGGGSSAPAPQAVAGDERRPHHQAGRQMGQQNNDDNHNNRPSDKRRRPAAAAAAKQQAAGSGLVESWLDYKIESEHDWGRLYCVASNSIGDQKRACYFNLAQQQQQRPTWSSDSSGQLAEEAASQADFQDPEEAQQRQQFACLPVNVTSNSVWIGCSGPQHPQQPAGAPAGGLRLSVLVSQACDDSSTAMSPPDNSLDDNRPAGAGGRPADHLSGHQSNWSGRLVSEELEEPLFAMQQLQANCNYKLQIESSSGGQRPTGLPASTSVSFRTLADASADNQGRHDMQPTIGRLVEPHGPELVAAALISTRSASGQPNNNKMDNLHRIRSPMSSVTSSANQQQQRLGQPGLMSSLSAGFWSLFRREPSDLASGRQQPGPASRQTAHSRHLARASPAPKLIDLSNPSWLVAFVGLILLATLIGLLFIHRLSASQAGAGSPRAPKSTTTTSSSEPDDDADHLKGQLESASSPRPTGAAAASSSSTTSRGPSPAAGVVAASSSARSRSPIGTAAGRLGAPADSGPSSLLSSSSDQTGATLTTTSRSPPNYYCQRQPMIGPDRPATGGGAAGTLRLSATASSGRPMQLERPAGEPTWSVALAGPPDGRQLASFESLPRSRRAPATGAAPAPAKHQAPGVEMQMAPSSQQQHRRQPGANLNFVCPAPANGASVNRSRSSLCFDSLLLDYANDASDRYDQHQPAPACGQPNGATALRLIHLAGKRLAEGMPDAGLAGRLISDANSLVLGAPTQPTRPANGAAKQQQQHCTCVAGAPWPYNNSDCNNNNNDNERDQPLGRPGSQDARGDRGAIGAPIVGLPAIGQHSNLAGQARQTRRASLTTTTTTEAHRTTRDNKLTLMSLDDDSATLGARQACLWAAPDSGAPIDGPDLGPDRARPGRQIDFIELMPNGNHFNDLTMVRATNNTCEGFDFGLVDKALVGSAEGSSSQQSNCAAGCSIVCSSCSPQTIANDGYPIQVNQATPVLDYLLLNDHSNDYLDNNQLFNANHRNQYDCQLPFEPANDQSRQYHHHHQQQPSSLGMSSFEGQQQQSLSSIVPTININENNNAPLVLDGPRPVQVGVNENCPVNYRQEQPEPTTTQVGEAIVDVNGFSSSSASSKSLRQKNVSKKAIDGSRLASKGDNMRLTSILKNSRSSSTSSASNHQNQARVSIGHEDTAACQCDANEDNPPSTNL